MNSSNKKSTKQRHLVSGTIIAKLANLSPLTLGRWRCEKRHFPYYIIGGAVKYDLDEITGIIESGRIDVGSLK